MSTAQTASDDPDLCECTPEVSVHASESLPTVNAAVSLDQLPADLRAFLETMDQFDQPIPIKDLQIAMQKLTFSVDDVREFAEFCSTSYQRNLIHTGPQYQALLICWKSGQRSTIHDHRGSACGVRIVDGSLMETVYEMTPDGHVYPTMSHEASKGYVCASLDMDIHQISNLQPEGNDLVTLHVYSPPMREFGAYSNLHSGTEVIDATP